MTQVLWQPGLTLEELDKLVILEALRFYGGNKTTTSISLGISIRTLDNKMAIYKEQEELLKQRIDDERAVQAAHLRRARGLPQENASTSGETQTLRESPDAGLCLEPVKITSKKPAVSVPKRKEVQSVLPKKAATGGA